MSIENKQQLKEFNDYQQEQALLAKYPVDDIYMAMAYTCLGLVGEAGEVSEKVKKAIRKQNLAELLRNEESVAEIAKELGDVLWYVSAVANEIGYTLEEIANINIAKLTDRVNRNVLIEGSGDNR